MEKEKKEAKEKTVNKTDKVNRTKQRNKIKFETAEQAEVKKFFIVILVVLCCVGAVYLFTRAFVSKDLFKGKEEETEEIQDGSVNYDVAIVGQIFNRPYSDYYVIIYNQNEGEYMSDMANIVSQYSALEDEDKLHMYNVDLSNDLNKSYYDVENENKSAKTLEELKLGDKTLLRIKKNKKTGNLEISKYITDIDAMKKELGIKE